MGEPIVLAARRWKDAGEAQERRERLGMAVRLARGSVTQADLAARLGMGQPAVSTWESGKVELTAEALWAIESSLGLPHGWLSLAGGYVDPRLEPLVVMLEASVRAARQAAGARRSAAQ